METTTETKPIHTWNPEVDIPKIRKAIDEKTLGCYHESCHTFHCKYFYAEKPGVTCIIGAILDKDNMTEWLNRYSLRQLMVEKLFVIPNEVYEEYRGGMVDKLIKLQQLHDSASKDKLFGDETREGLIAKMELYFIDEIESTLSNKELNT